MFPLNCLATFPVFSQNFMLVFCFCFTGPTSKLIDDLSFSGLTLPIYSALVCVAKCFEMLGEKEKSRRKTKLLNNLGNCENAHQHAYTQLIYFLINCAANESALNGTTDVWYNNDIAFHCCLIGLIVKASVSLIWSLLETDCILILMMHFS